MRKTYTKPYIVVESFQLNAAIAASCSSEGKVSLGFYQNSCTLAEEAPGLGYFGYQCAADGGVDVINFTEGGDGNDTVCYHGPIYSDMFMNS